MKTLKTRKRRIIALILAMIMAVSCMPADFVTRQAAAADEETALEMTKIADSDTSTRPIDVFAGTTKNAGRILVGKTVEEMKVDYSSEASGAQWTVSDLENFLVTVSQSAQTMGVSSEIPVPLDVVFVLDTSGSMAYSIKNGSDNASRADQRATHMVAAANDAIDAILAANSLNRVGVVAFSDGTTVLSELGHYEDTDAGNSASEHLQWASWKSTDSGGHHGGTNQRELVIDSTSGSLIVGRDNDAANTLGGYRNGTNGGTNIQAGIAAGAQLLSEAEDTTVTLENGQTVVRLPFLIILSDGAPTYSSTSENWKLPGTAVQGDGNNAYVGNGFLAALTASYYKKEISKHYFGTNVTDSNRAYVYTIGVGLSTMKESTDKALAEITLNPKDNLIASNQFYQAQNTSDTSTDYFKNYWDKYLAGTASFTIKVNSGNGGNSTYTVRQSTIDGEVKSLAYNDQYYPVSSADTMTNAFKNIVIEIQKRAIAYPTLTDTTLTDNFSGYVTFTDEIGEYMEVKDVKGVIGDGNLYQGLQFAKYMDMTQAEIDADADAQTFMKELISSLETRFHLLLPEDMKDDGIAVSMDRFIKDAWNWSHDRSLTQDTNSDGFADELPGGGTNPRTQMYYESDSDYDNSICWWANVTEGGDIQLLGWAADDSIEYIEEAQELAASGSAEIIYENGLGYVDGFGTVAPAGANYVCRSYFYYGTAGGTVEAEKEYLQFTVRVMRSLEEPYSQTVVVSAPASLLAMQRVLIYDIEYDDNGDPVITAYYDEITPTRVIYEVGLQDRVNAQTAESILSDTYKAENSYVTEDGGIGYEFYTNEWNREYKTNGEPAALTTAEFEAASSNTFYTYQEDTPILVKNADGTYSQYIGTDRPSGTYYYAKEYYTYTYDQTNADGKTAVPAQKKIIYIEIYIPADAEASTLKYVEGKGWYVAAGTYTSSSLSEGEITDKKANETETAPHVAHPTRTNSATNPHYTIYLGNNGKLSMPSVKTKNVYDESGATDLDGETVQVGQTLTYTVSVTNTNDTAADAVITDTIPAGTAYVDGSETVTDKSDGEVSGYTFTNSDGTLAWNFKDVPAGETYTVSFRVQVTAAAVIIGTLSNYASIKLGDNEYTTNTTTNPVEGKIATGGTPEVLPSEGVKVGDVLQYTIRYYNDTDAVSDVTIIDVLPEGTEYVTGSAVPAEVSFDSAKNSLTWVIGDVAANTGGTVTFKVMVTADAQTTVDNKATITIGDHSHETNINTTEIKTGDLVLTKEILAAEDLNPDLNEEFILELTESTGKLSGEFTLLIDGVESENKAVFTEGKATVTIKDGGEVNKVDGQKLTIKGLPVGVSITVTEKLTEDNAGYTAAYSPASGAVTIVEGDSPAQVDVTNTYTASSTDNLFDYILSVKTLTSKGAALSNKSFSFLAQAVTVAEENGVITGDAAAVPGVEPMTGEVTVNSGETVEIKGTAKQFDQVGTYYYLLTEVAGTISGIHYDSTQFLIKAVVTDDGSGKLNLAVTLFVREQIADDPATDTIESGWTAWTEVEDIDEYGNPVAEFENVYIPKETSIELVGTKILLGRELKDNEFGFEIKDEDGMVAATGVAAADGTIRFSKIYFTEAGTYEYKVIEVDGGLGGVTYSDAVIEITIVVTDDGNGALSAAVDASSPAIVFTNTYTPDPVSVQFEGVKSLTGRKLGAGEFTFIVTDENGETVATGTNSADGTIVFEPISYTKDQAGKTYTYTIKEVEPDVSYQPNITYDRTEFTVKVTVNYDESTGLLSTSVEYVSDVKFENVYTPDPITVVPTDNLASKTTTTEEGETAGNGNFSFSVVDKDGVERSVGVGAANGTITFTEIMFTEPGEYTFWIQESNAGSDISNGITYDKIRYRMVVTVVQDSETGELSASVTYYKDDSDTELGSGADVTFNNKYNAKGELTITANKVLSGRALYEGEFGFTLTKSDGTSINGVVAANGTITFATLYYTEADVTKEGEYLVYTVKEINAGLPGVDYDESVYTLYVQVLDNDDGTLTVHVDHIEKDGGLYTGELIFTNTYQADGTEAEIVITKALTGKALDEGEFTFVLEHNDQVVARAVNGVDSDGDGVAEVTFKLTYPAGTATGEYQYTIREINNSQPGVTYDTNSYDVTVIITDNTDEGKLEAEVVYPESGIQFNNSYKASAASITLAASKVLTGDRELEAKDFDFVVTDADGKNVAVGYNKADGTITFTAIGFNTTGTYTYYITETPGIIPGVTYDTTVYKAEIVVTDDTVNGKLVAELVKVTKIVTDGNGNVSETDVSGIGADGDTQAVFTNAYDPEETSVILNAVKVLEDKSGADPARVPSDREFSFEVYRYDPETGTVGELISTASNTDADKDGLFDNVVFTEIDLTEAGTYTFIMKELSGTEQGMSYTDAVYEVVVVVENNTENGRLEVTSVTYKLQGSDGEGTSEIPIFTNTYDPEDTSAVISVRKTLTGRNLIEGEFTFTAALEGTDKKVTAVNGADGTIIFSDPDGVLKFDEVGEYVFIIEEITGTLDNVAYDGATYSVTVKVTDVNGKLQAEVVYPESGVIFKNVYTPDPVKVEPIIAAKVLEGKTLTAGAFTFQIQTVDGIVVAEASNDADGKIVFENIELSAIGTYNYVIVEVSGNAGGMTYDSRQWPIEIKVTDVDGDGVLETSVTYIGTPVFTNVYDAADVKLYLKADKALTGKELQAGQYTFYVAEKLADGTYVLRATAVNAADGEIVFPGITITEPGEYTYIVGEQKGSESGVTYDSAVYEAKVTVVDNGAGQLVITRVVCEATGVDVTYPGDEAVDLGAVFKNTYVPAPADVTISAVKNLLNKVLESGEFSFELIDKATGERVPGTAVVTNDTDGNVIFNVPVSEAGEYTWIISEISGNDSHITYDETDYEVIVKVVDNLNGQLVVQSIRYQTVDGAKPVFENVYTPDPISVVLEAAKNLTGKELSDGMFTFLLKDTKGTEDTSDDTLVAVGSNETDGSVEIKVEFTEPGTYDYVLVEQNDAQGGFTYDETEHPITIVVTADEDGVLHAEVQYENGTDISDIVFENVYDAADCEVILTGTKTLVGGTKKLDSGAFEFVVSEYDAASGTYVVVARGTNDASGKITFYGVDENGTVTADGIIYDAPGTHYYLVSEVKGDAAGVTYDTAKFKVVVEVKDVDGELEAVVTYSNGTDISDIAFVNEYKAAPVTAKIEASKTLLGKALADGMFTFRAVDQEGNVVGTGTNDADGNVVIEIGLDKTGTYTFTVSEVNTNEAFVSYDSASWTAVVTVTDEDGVLKADVKYTDGEITFVNVYDEPQIPEAPTEEAPDTGDHTAMPLWAVLAVLSAAAAAVAVVVRKKRYGNE